MKIQVNSSVEIPRLQVHSKDDPTVSWQGAFILCGGQGASQSSTIAYEIEPGKRLGWHTDATEETQYIISGTGELHVDGQESQAVSAGSVFALPPGLRHDIVNTGSVTMHAVAFFAAAMFTQTFDDVMLPPDTHVLGTPNRNG